MVGLLLREKAKNGHWRDSPLKYEALSLRLDTGSKWKREKWEDEDGKEREEKQQNNNERLKKKRGAGKSIFVDALLQSPKLVGFCPFLSFSESVYPSRSLNA